MRQFVEYLFIAQGCLAALMLAGAYAGAHMCRRHQRREAQAVRATEPPAARASASR